jgi:hypothetical protein
MMILGLLLIAAAAGFAIDVFVENTDNIDVDVLGRTFTVAPGWLLAAGAAAALVACLGFLMIGNGMARARNRRRKMRDAARERDELARTLEAERAQRAEQPDVDLTTAARNDELVASPSRRDWADRDANAERVDKPSS